ncbi:uncharacterized protein Eint_091710 [Encephalitozoon intestinalis ATCC 50506]|uniref:Uncharacterized protein n=1 Tax=Encephalitozoon intestinalis (strain ATCC 50506) TaxID=876142 RepID=E0S943_ENCIT|nr:uncharacterized protein Eint_091710 [Encephalitozoon intestinalis ATCC 50506]ADM12299.1 hypothetical protein Eint_091710 [Encephalitozoon intestinalis ATCC 50506]UTX46110.1 hypothetical protein GPK93_09g16980 [Encephalitozoon intestinalis]
MVPESVNNLYKDLESVILQFKSPAFGNYFLKKAKEEFDNISIQTSKQKDEGAIERYLKDQGELLDVLRRQTTIYNMFYDESSGI